MKITSYKKIKNKTYEITLEDNSKYKINEDIIVKYNLINNDFDINKILEENKIYDIYDKILKYISIKIRSKKEIIKYIEKYKLNNKDIKIIINRLEKNNYINDNYYAKCYIHDKILLTNHGPNKIKKYLINQDIKEEIIDNELILYNDNLQKEKINKYINKEIKNNKKSEYYFKNKILINLINLGFNENIIKEILNNIEIDDKELKQKEEIKIREKLSKKYDGNILEYKIKEKLYQKGFR